MSCLLQATAGTQATCTGFGVGRGVVSSCGQQLHATHACSCNFVWQCNLLHDLVVMKQAGSAHHKAGLHWRTDPFAPCLCSLQAKFRGYFVPPRPEKNAVEGQRMSDNFVEERRASLQKYLQKLAAHPVIGPSDVRLGSDKDRHRHAAMSCLSVAPVPVAPTPRALSSSCISVYDCGPGRLCGRISTSRMLYTLESSM